jgi:hypothetical protein
MTVLNLTVLNLSVLKWSVLKRSVLKPSILMSLMALTACANSPDSQSLQDSFAADPQLEQSTPSPQPTETAAIPDAPDLDRLPPQLPQYQPATWLETTELDGDRLRSRWQSDDPAEVIAEFYRGRLQGDNWQLNGDGTEGDTIQLTATGRINGQDWPLTVEIRPQNSETTGEDSTAEAENTTEIELTYPTSPSTLSQTDPEDNQTPQASPTPDNPAETPEPQATPSPPAQQPSQTTQFSDLDNVSDPLTPYVQDVAQLGILSPVQGDRFGPEETITRRDYARWLMQANNRFYADQSVQQLRQPRDSSEPAFQDMPRSHPDFAVVQGLAEAGIIPSPLSESPMSGNETSSGATTALFRPDDPLLREDLLHWKVPLDVRRGLPDATVEAIGETWGFQDATRISAEALDAVLADFENGEHSNIRRAFGYTTLLQPKKPVTRAEAASSLWSFGYQDEVRSASDLIENEN